MSYKPFGPEWKAEMMKWRKEDMVNMLADNLRDKVDQLQSIAIGKTLNTDRHTAAVLVINRRYFYKFGKKGQVLTAWTLAGAKLFQEFDRIDLERAKDRLREKSKRFTQHQVQLLSPTD